MITLSKRLDVIARSVPVGSNAVDVGADHGYLAIYLKKSGIAKKVIACDINQLPLNNAKENALKYNADIELVLSDGLEKIDPAFAETIIIAGMGAEVICGIIGRAEWLKDTSKTLILQPMNSPEFLREYLAKNGFSQVSEQAVEDTGKLYTVIVARYTGKNNDDINFFYRGLLSNKNETDRLFLLKQLKRLENWLLDITPLDAKRDECNMLKGVVDNLKTFLGEN